MSDMFSRTELLLGKEKVDILKNSKVAIFGIGGVGSFVLEGLARAGIGSFILVDNDTISESNLNRQLIATTKTIGRPKVEVAKERVLAINPKANGWSGQLGGMARRNSGVSIGNKVGTDQPCAEIRKGFRPDF